MASKASGGTRSGGASKGNGLSPALQTRLESHFSGASDVMAEYKITGKLAAQVNKSIDNMMSAVDGIKDKVAGISSVSGVHAFDQAVTDARASISKEANNITKLLEANKAWDKPQMKKSYDKAINSIETVEYNANKVLDFSSYSKILIDVEQYFIDRNKW